MTVQSVPKCRSPELRSPEVEPQKVTVSQDVPYAHDMSRDQHIKHSQLETQQRITRSKSIPPQESSAQEPQAVSVQSPESVRKKGRHVSFQSPPHDADEPATQPSGSGGPESGHQRGPGRGDLVWSETPGRNVPPLAGSRMGVVHGVPVRKSMKSSHRRFIKFVELQGGALRTRASTGDAKPSGDTPQRQSATGQSQVQGSTHECPHPRMSRHQPPSTTSSRWRRNGTQQCPM